VLIGDISANVAKVREYLSILYYCVASVFYVVASLGAVLAWRRFWKEKQFERLLTLYAHANQLWRVGLSIQQMHQNGERLGPDVVNQVATARNALKNWFYDNRFLFDDKIAEFVMKADDEAKSIVSTGDMTHLRALREELERRFLEAGKRGIWSLFRSLFRKLFRK